MAVAWSIDMISDDMYTCVLEEGVQIYIVAFVNNKKQLVGTHAYFCYSAVKCPYEARCTLQCITRLFIISATSMVYKCTIIQLPDYLH
jgi:hypothetical protein